MKQCRILPVLLALSLLAGCVGAGMLAPVQGSMKPLPTPQGSLPPVTVPDCLSQDVLTGYDSFSTELLKHSRREGKNVLVSPLSVTLALGMTANGAAEETLREFEALFGLDRDNLNSLCARFMADYAALGGSTEATLVNSLWADPDLTLANGFVLRCQDTYGAQLFQQDLQDPATVKAVNQWVNEATRGLIPSVVDEFDHQAVLALINAIYLKNKFAHPFETPYSEWEMDFTAEDGTVTHPKGMSNGTRNEEYISGKNEQGVLLPYDDERLGLLLLLPQEGISLTDYLDGWDKATIPTLLSTRQETRVSLTCPKFKTEWSASLNDSLQAMGLSQAFDPQQADFSAMGNAGGDPLYIGDVIHKTAFELNEKGTEAAAVTAVIMECTSAMPPQNLIYLRFDRPFVYGIVDMETGAPLFLGTMERCE